MEKVGTTVSTRMLRNILRGLPTALFKEDDTALVKFQDIFVDIDKDLLYMGIIIEQLVNHRK